MRRQFTMDVIAEDTLYYLYVDLVLPVQEIADKLGKTRVRIWQLIHEYPWYEKGRITKECLNCKNKFKPERSRVRRGHGKYCSDKCYYEHKASAGYNPSRQGQRIARKIIEAYLGFQLPIGFIVHHEDGDQSKNFLENLFVFPDNASHIAYHHAKRNGTGELPYQELWELPGKIDEWLTKGDN